MNHAAAHVLSEPLERPGQKDGAFAYGDPLDGETVRSAALNVNANPPEDPSRR